MDRYWKRHLLRSNTGYRQNPVPKNFHRNYLDSIFDVQPKDQSAAGSQMHYPPSVALDPGYLNKIRLAWGFGFQALAESNPLRRRFPGLIQGYKLEQFSNDKLPSVTTAFGAWHASSIGEARKFGLEIGRRRGWIVPSQTLSRRNYLALLSNYEFALSPFGWGEMCYRDYEIAVTGATLIKPSVEHLATFPSLLVDGETYMSIPWDPRKWEAEIELILSTPGARNIGANLQDQYRASLSDDYASKFASHLTKCLIGNDNCGYCERGWWGP